MHERPSRGAGHVVVWLNCLGVERAAMAWVVAAGAVLLGIAIAKALVDSRSKIYRCPYCNLVLKKNATPCPRCGRPIAWG